MRVKTKANQEGHAKTTKVGQASITKLLKENGDVGQVSIGGKGGVGSSFSRGDDGVVSKDNNGMKARIGPGTSQPRKNKVALNLKSQVRFKTVKNDARSGGTLLLLSMPLLCDSINVINSEAHLEENTCGGPKEIVEKVTVSVCWMGPPLWGHGCPL
ncbi:hypothetical protein SESBI_19979 [Sesbania bispinosa]|nr:hypothetical protein SESBI_19979 [Sesbania bispinosa]